MIRNVWTVLCRDIITDQETNAVSYVRCIEEGSASSLPVSIGPVFLGTLWEKQDQEQIRVGFRIILLTPGQERQTVLQTKPLVLDRLRHRLNFRVNSLHLQEFGTYHLSLECLAGRKWVEAARLPVLIRQIDRPAAQE
ncbi:MAG: hypothetical protein ACOC3Y_01785 [Desulfohalobiaceae bacterium]